MFISASSAEKTNNRHQMRKIFGGNLKSGGLTTESTHVESTITLFKK